MANPNHQVVWLPARPDFSIRTVKSTSHNCYHETTYEVMSRAELDAADIKRLDECGLLGIGQAYYLKKSEVVTDVVNPVTVDRRTDAVLADVPPVNFQGDPFTHTYEYTYNRYEILRVCDSGD